MAKITIEIDKLKDVQELRLIISEMAEVFAAPKHPEPLVMDADKTPVTTPEVVTKSFLNEEEKQIIEEAESAPSPIPISQYALQNEGQETQPQDAAPSGDTQGKSKATINRERRKAAIEEANRLGVKFADTERVTTIEKRIQAFKQNNNAQGAVATTPEEPAAIQKTETAAAPKTESIMDLESGEIKTAEQAQTPDCYRSTLDLAKLCMQYLEELPGERADKQRSLYQLLELYGGDRAPAKIAEAGKLDVTYDVLESAVMLNGLIRDFGEEAGLEILTLIGCPNFSSVPAGNHALLTQLVEEKIAELKG